MTAICDGCKAPTSCPAFINVRHFSSIRNDEVDPTTSKVIRRITLCGKPECERKFVCLGRSCNDEDYNCPLVQAADEPSCDTQWLAVSRLPDGRLYHAACVERCDQCGTMSLETGKFFRVCADAAGIPLDVMHGGYHSTCSKCATLCYECSEECAAPGCEQRLPRGCIQGMHTDCRNYLQSVASVKRNSDSQTNSAKRQRE